MGCLSGCGILIIAVVVGIVAEALILGSTGGILGFIVACAVFYELNKTAKENREEDERKKAKASEKVSEDPTSDNTLIQAVFRPAGECSKCKQYSAWWSEWKFERGDMSKLICQNCDPAIAGDFPSFDRADWSRTSLTLKPAGHCLKCGQDALWNQVHKTSTDAETLFFCSYCEIHLTGHAPFTRTGSDLLANLPVLKMEEGRPSASNSESAVCPACYHVNVSSARYCTRCGLSLT